MSSQTERLPSGVVKFTISREELKDILSEKYDVDVESVSFEEVGVSISLRVPEKEDKEEKFGEEAEGELGEGESDVSNY
ncbi:hypothetical protein AKJ37_02220 [candidate division MSBL1 archaeon SCGC-AAA259I09]|uniref:Uncharacterized protein n=2 Tax=candidate division MSBL1 TaxID=215777 RepID=A0A133UUH9_9EURY|nr:hypothetical protein AKJ61_04530 [candidate division MSBL1 archaeon SCGC-AAA259B11]KXA97862.1 hypothetical protein AKJ37_02220 [candidate division MSBL1 archaeon SCGC-AAA259I09]